jgi:hypothetical protein
MEELHEMGIAPAGRRTAEQAGFSRRFPRRVKLTALRVVDTLKAADIGYYVEA